MAVCTVLKKIGTSKQSKRTGFVDGGCEKKWERKRQSRKENRGSSSKSRTWMAPVQCHTHKNSFVLLQVLSLGFLSFRSTTSSPLTQLTHSLRISHTSPCVHYIKCCEQTQGHTRSSLLSHTSTGTLVFMHIIYLWIYFERIYVKSAVNKEKYVYGVAEVWPLYNKKL